MSLSEKNSVVFAYESSVHSTNLLLSLDDQRKQDILCDVTILVEDQRFRAHKAVLAACSSYFLSRIVGQVDADLIITLPEEVTLKGFSPLLQFAYTAKLILNKDNVSEVCKCAEFLGVHNIEESCFQFLKFKFLDFKLDQQECPRKKCCPQRCQETNPKIGNVDDGDLEIDDGEELLEKEYSQTPDTKLCKDEENAKSSPALRDNANHTCGLERGSVSSLSSQCPKYRKFQKAFGNDKVHTSESSSSIKDVQVPPIATFLEKEIPDNVGIQKAQECVPMQSVSKCEETQVKMEEGEEGTEKKEESRDSVTQNVLCPVEKMDFAAFPQNSAAPHGLNSVSFLHSCEQYGNLNFSSMQNNTVLPEKTVSGSGVGNDKTESQDDTPSKIDFCTREATNITSAGERSSVEREVAEHLAKGFWSDIYSTEACQIHLPPAVPKECLEPVSSGKKSECPWLGIRISESPEPCSQRTFTTLSSVNCPFISNLSTEGCSNASEISSGDYVHGQQQQEQCPYNYVISLGEDSETDTEGDSESCSAREQECEVKLPFNAQRIISLSRNDFQSFLKMHKLTPEQLDCIHDIRRRSKNRIAAQRCRKRKLDCIQNLESEIEKLQNEKENLLKERNHILSTLGETKQNLTGLCQQVCKEAALSHEQIQILAKYSSSDCPLSFLFPERERTAPADHEPVMPAGMESADGPSGVTSPEEQNSCYQCMKTVCDATYNQVQELHPVSVRTLEKSSLLEQCGQSSGITDFCKQMTDKCTTDE
ncbi:BACH1 protein, partial [Galbula dea]|nr:BACH1 protein [Galbula dea]